MEDPELASTISLREISTGRTISSQDWEYVTSGTLGGKPRIKKIKTLITQYGKDPDTFMLTDFLRECHLAIEAENQYLESNSAKDVFSKYLSCNKQVGLLCAMCPTSNVQYKNVSGLMSHIARAHGVKVVENFEKSNNEAEFTRIRAALGRINFKSSKNKAMTPQELQNIISIPSVASSNEIEEAIANIPDAFEAAHETAFEKELSPLANIIDVCVAPDLQNVELDESEANEQVRDAEPYGIDKSICPPRQSMTSTPQMHLTLTTPPRSPSRNKTPCFADFDLDENEEPVDVSSLLTSLDIAAEEEESNMTVSTTEVVTINLKDLRKTPLPDEANNNPENVTSKQYMNMTSEGSVELSETLISPKSLANSDISTIMEVDDSVHNSSMCSKTTDFECEMVSAASADPTTSSSSAAAAVAAIPTKSTTAKQVKNTQKKGGGGGALGRKGCGTGNKKLSMVKAAQKSVKRKYLETPVVSAPTKRRKIEPSNKKPTPQKGIAKKNLRKIEVLTKKPKSTAKNTGGVVVPKTAQTRTSRTKDEDNSVWAHELVTSIEQNAADELNEIANNPHRKKLIACVKESVNVPAAKRKAVKNKIADAFKKFETHECNEKTNPECRDNLAFLANCKIDAEYFSKKTNKNNNPFRPAELIRQVKIYLDFYSKNGSIQKTNAQVKQHVEAALSKKCKDTGSINTWKKHLNNLKTLSLKDFEKRLDKLLHHYQKVSAIHNILVAIKQRVKVFKPDGSSNLKYEIVKAAPGKAGNSSKAATATAVTAAGGPKLVKNLMLQLSKGSLSNLKHTLSAEAAQAYVNWFKEYRLTKESLSITNNVKWFMTCVEGVMYGGNSPMNPVARISKTEIEKVMKYLVDLVKSTCNFNMQDMDVELFTSSFYQNLTIFCMKYIYEIYSEILRYYKLHQSKCQQPNLFHVGLFQINQGITNEKTKLSAPEIVEQYTQFMKNQATKKNSNASNVFGVNRLIMCLFQMKFIASHINIKSTADLKNVINTDCLKIIDLIESKCSVRVINHIKSMLFEVMYNIVNNVISPRTSNSTTFSKKISWHFYSRVLFDASFFRYPKVAYKVLHSFNPISLKGCGEPAKEDVILDDDARVWHTVLHKHRSQLFTELYKDYLSLHSCAEVTDAEMTALEDQRYGSANVTNTDTSSSSSDDSDEDEDEEDGDDNMNTDTNDERNEDEDENESSDDDDDDEDNDSD